MIPGKKTSGRRKACRRFPFSKHSVVLAQADPDGQALEQANARYAALEAEHAALLFELLTDGGTENE